MPARIDVVSASITLTPDQWETLPDVLLCLCEDCMMDEDSDDAVARLADEIGKAYQREVVSH